MAQDFGRRLIPNIIDQRARDEPDRIVFSIPLSSTSAAAGYRDVSARDFANAVNRTAWWLKKELGDDSTPRSIAYIGPNDIRYVLLVLGCAKAGFQALLISPKNSAEAALAVLEAAKCNIWVTPEKQPKLLPELLPKRSLRVLTCASVDDLLQPELVSEFPYNKTFEQASEEVLCINHTSGSTGHPKPILWKHSMLATLDATRLLPEDRGRLPWTTVFEKNDRFCSIFPFSHTAGCVMNILINAFYETTNVLCPSEKPASIDLVDQLLDNVDVRVWHIIPSIIDEIGDAPDMHQKFTNAKVLIASGGPVTYERANKLTSVIRLINITGTSEGLFQGSLLPEQEDWIYFAFHPYAHFDFRPNESGLYEHFAVRDEKHFALFQGLFHTFPNISEMSLKDLYAPHPSKPELWVYKGRTDDMVVLSSGEKVFPADMEAAACQNPDVNAALMAGTTRFQPVLLVEPSKLISDAERTAFLDGVFEALKATNASVASFARIARECLIIASPDKPFSRTDKGTIKRRLTIDSYEKEISLCYEELEGLGNGENVVPIDFSTLETTSAGIRELLLTTISPPEPLTDSTDFFAAGVDSIVATRFVHDLRRSAHAYNADRAAKIELNNRLVYANPTITQFSDVVFKLMTNQKIKPLNPVDVQIKHMKQLRIKYDAKLPRNVEKRVSRSDPDGNTILLTGSTGALGSYLLEELLKKKSVKKIYCLNRGTNGQERQIKSSSSCGLRTDWPAEKVKFLAMDITRPKFALSDADYDELLHNVSHILHNQWPVNLNFDVISFEPYIRGVRHLVNFSLESDRAPSLTFVSTMACVRHIKNVDAIPEKPVEELLPYPSGYYASKQVSELVLYRAWERSGVDIRICRLGQLAGPVLRGNSGMWAMHDWVTTVIASSKRIGVLPSTLGALDSVKWIPVDIMANIIIELADFDLIKNTKSPVKSGVTATVKEISSDDTPTCPTMTPTSPTPPKTGAPRQDLMPVYNVTNTEETNWAALVPTVRARFGDSIKEVVSWVEWTERLAASEATESDPDKNPGLKLLNWYRSPELLGLPAVRASTERSETKSGTLAALPAVGAKWMNTWLDQWNF